MRRSPPYFRRQMHLPLVWAHPESECGSVGFCCVLFFLFHVWGHNLCTYLAVSPCAQQENVFTAVKRERRSEGKLLVAATPPAPAHKDRRLTAVEETAPPPGQCARLPHNVVRHILCDSLKPVCHNLGLIPEGLGCGGEGLCEC
jgi:hypothetical protein